MQYSINMMFARSLNNVIGNKGKLPDWKIKGDLAWFKELTMGAIVIMGKKTWYSLPFKLPGRYSIVITSEPNKLERVPYDPKLFNPETLAQIAALRPDVMPDKMPERRSADATAPNLEWALHLARERVRFFHAEDWGKQDWLKKPDVIPEFRKIFIIGGVSLFMEAESVVDTVYETVVKSEEIQGDTFYELRMLNRELVSSKPTTALVYDSKESQNPKQKYMTVGAVFNTWKVTK